MIHVTRRRFLGAAAAAGAGMAGAALVGCSSAPSTPAAKSPPATPAQPAAQATPQKPTADSIIGKHFGNRDGGSVPVYGGALIYAPGSPVLANLDPITSASAMVHNVVTNSYSGLLLGSRPPDDKNGLELYPDLATSWEIPGPLKMVFKIREGVKFHNVAPVNGRVFTSEDVKFSVLRSKNEKTSRFGGALAWLKDIETPDATTVVFNGTRFDPYAFPGFGNHVAWMVPKELHDQKMMNDHIIGTGPFIFERWDQDSKLVFKKNPDYYIKGTPFADELTMLQIGNAETRLAALQSGQSVTGGIPQAQFPLVKDNKDLVFEKFLSVAPQVMFMNFKNPLFKDDRVRKAISLAIDPNVIIKLASDGEGLWRGVISAQHSGWAMSQEELKSKKYFLRQDVQQAKQLMAAAGHPNGIATGFLYNTSYPQTYQDNTQYMIEQLKKTGVASEIKVVGQEHATFRKNQDEHNYEGLIYGLDGQGTPEAFLLDYRTGGPKNGSGFSDAAIDKKIDDTVGTVDTKERQQKAKGLVDDILQNVYWKIEFMDSYNIEANRKELKNYVSVPPFWYRTPMHFAWVDK